MKKIILLISLLFSLSACKKEETVLQLKAFTTPPLFIATKADTIPDGAMVGIKLVKDSINSDETLLVFDHTSSPNYNPMEDARYLAGMGQVSLASVSADGIDLSINSSKYIYGMSIPLDVHTRVTSAVYLEISREHNIPAVMQIWVKDNYLKDSVNLCTQVYHFVADKTDTSTFGNKRFKVFFKMSQN
jgi:trimeric autotransporter adhesin